MTQHSCVQCGVLVESLAPPHNTWCESCFEAVNTEEDTAPSVTVEQQHPFHHLQGSFNPPQEGSGSMPSFLEFFLGAKPQQTCSVHPDGCPPYDPTKYQACEWNNNVASMVELSFA